MRRRVFVAAWFVTHVVAVLGMTAAPVHAHAGLESSTPAASSVLEESPPQIVLDFDEPVETALAVIDVFDAQRRTIEIGPVQRAGDGSIVTADVPDLADGTYVVVWRIVSIDGHAVEGAFSFQVGLAATADADALIAEVQSGAGSDGALVPLLVAVRVLGYLGIVVLVGAGLFALAGPAHLLRARSTMRLVVIGAASFVVGSVLQFGLQGADAIGGALADTVDPSVWADYAATRTGRVLLARTAAALFLLGAVLVLRARTTVWWRSIVLIAVLVGIVSFPLGGHPSAATPELLWVTVDAVHLMAVSLWVGGLLLFTVGGRAWRRDDDALGVLRGFSATAAVAVPLIVVTGVLQSVELAGGTTALTDGVTATTWGRLLLVKVAIAVVAIVIGGVSRWLLRRGGAPSVRRTITAEATLAVVIVALVAGMVGEPPRPPVPARVTQVTLTQAGLLADVTVTPGRVGTNEMHVVVTPAGGSLTPVSGVRARISLPAAGIPDTPVDLRALGPDHFSGRVAFPVAGDWTLELLVEPTPGSILLLSTTVVIPESLAAAGRPSA